MGVVIPIGPSVCRDCIPTANCAECSHYARLLELEFREDLKKGLITQLVPRPDMDPVDPRD